MMENASQYDWIACFDPIQQNLLFITDINFLEYTIKYIWSESIVMLQGNRQLG